MKWLTKFRFGFDFWGLILFLIVMLPNFIWFAVPAPNDVLRAESVTPVVDMIASVCQVLTVACLCFVIHKERSKTQNDLNKDFLFLKNNRSFNRMSLFEIIDNNR